MMTMVMVMMMMTIARNVTGIAAAAVEMLCAVIVGNLS
jgi:hypothetical protein